MTLPWQSDDPEVIANLKSWLKEQPQCVQERVRTHPLGLYYNNGKPGETRQIMELIGYNSAKNGTVCTAAICAVTLEWNAFLFMERRVFGVPFTDLEPIAKHPDEVCKEINAQRGGLTSEEARKMLPPADLAIQMFKQQHDHEPCGDPNCVFHREES